MAEGVTGKRWVRCACGRPLVKVQLVQLAGRDDVLYDVGKRLRDQTRVPALVPDMRGEQVFRCVGGCRPRVVRDAALAAALRGHAGDLVLGVDV